MTQSQSFSPATSTTSEIGNSWLLPDGVHDVLFANAEKQQHLRYKLINCLQLHGFELVTPPMIEFTESLLGNASEDLKRQTFKIIDQLSGRLMGVRADTTPQILRIDANLATKRIEQTGHNGIARYCYAGHTIRTLPIGLFGLRTPLQLGAEIFGTDSIEAHFELLNVLSVLLRDLKLNAKIHFDLGHVGIFRRLSELSGLSKDSIEQLTKLYDNKALPELKFACNTLNMGEDFYTLARYGHDLQSLKDKLSSQASGDCKVISAIDELQAIHDHVKTSNQSITISIDVSDLSGYHYHSGMMFNVYVNDSSQADSQALLRGGRFEGLTAHSVSDNIPRPAIGFSMDVTRLLPFFELETSPVVLVDFTDMSEVNNRANTQKNIKQKNILLQKVAKLRSQDYRVVIPLSIDDKPSGVTHTLIFDGEWVLKAC